MERDGDEVHVGTDEARGASTPNVVRWILGISLLLAIVLLSVTWITGALSAGKAGTEATAVDRTADESGTASTDTDSVVSDRADELEAAPSGEATEPGTVEN